MENTIKNKRIMTYICLGFVFVISCLSRMAIYYAQHIAYGYDFDLTYHLIKSIIVCAVCFFIYFFVSRYSYRITNKHHLIIGCTGAVVVFGLMVLKSTLLKIDVAVLSSIFGYIYAAVPFLQVIVICSLAKLLQYICEEKSVLKTVLFIVSSVLFLSMSDNIFRMILLIAFGTVYISELKNKGITSKTVKVLIGIILILLLVGEIYELGYAVGDYIKMFDKPGYMTVIARNTWSEAKTFGSIVNSTFVSGDVTDYSILWLISYIGIVPTVLIVLLSIVSLLFVVLKNKTIDTKSNAFRCVALSYIIVCTVFAMLINSGVILSGFFTQMPVLPDTVAGIMSIFSLLGYNCVNETNK